MQELEHFSGNQILEISQNKSRNIEFNDVSEKVSGLATLVVDGSGAVENVRHIG